MHSIKTTVALASAVMEGYTYKMRSSALWRQTEKFPVYIILLSYLYLINNFQHCRG